MLGEGSSHTGRHVHDVWTHGAAGQGKQLAIAVERPAKQLATWPDRSVVVQVRLGLIQQGLQDHLATHGLSERYLLFHALVLFGGLLAAYHLVFEVAFHLSLRFDRVREIEVGSSI